MAKLSEKALRPRQYVFNRLCKSRVASLTPAISKLCEHEQRQALSMRAARRATDQRHPAARHADNIMGGGTSLIRESDDIEDLERELEELRARRQQMFERLRQSKDIENRQAQQTRGNGNGAKRKRDDIASDNVVGDGRQSEEEEEEVQQGDAQGQSSRGHNRHDGI